MYDVVQSKKIFRFSSDLLQSELYCLRFSIGVLSGVGFTAESLPHSGDTFTHRLGHDGARDDSF